MNRRVQRTVTAVLTLGCQLAAGIALGGGEFSQPGGYRPVEGQGGSTAPGQFPPTENRGNAQRWNATPRPLPSPTLPAQPLPSAGGYSYAPQGYGGNTWSQPTHAPSTPQYDNRNWVPPIPNPTNVLDSFFGNSHRSEPSAGHLPPPPPPPVPPVAPVYNPPVPVAPPTYGSVYPTQPGYQPQVTYPTQPAYQPPTGYPAQQTLLPTQQPGYAPSRNPAPGSHSQPPQHPQPASQALAVTPAPASTTAPRPFSNPQESGNSFTPRTITIQPGRNDTRFRPPELKGTP